MKELIRKELENIRPVLQADGGDVSIKEITDNGIVKVELHGTCKGCLMSEITMKYVIKKRLKSAIPEIKEIYAV